MNLSPNRKICVLVTARPSYARIKTVLENIKKHTALELQLVVGASALLERYGPVVDVIRADGFEPDEVIYSVVEGENLVTSAKSTGLGIIELASVLDKLQPDAVISIADRYETLATAIAASYMNIPIVHIQGGEVTGSIDEKVRHAVTKLSDCHFVANDSAAERVLKMGEDPDTVFVTGCPSIDLADRVQIDTAPFNPFDKYNGVGTKFDLSKGYLVVMQHPVTTEYEASLRQIEATLASIAELQLPTFWFWPNVDAGSDQISKAIRHFREQNDAQNIYLYKNLPPEDFLRLISKADCLIGNSSVGIRESAYLGIPVVNIGNRQVGRDRGPNVIDTTYDSAAITSAVRHQLNNGHYPKADLYGDGKAGEKIADLLSSITLKTSKMIAY
jgi:UDP-hydrolysing UDP-N-acetyl-D-glucosamine 2-epimerase